MVWPSSAGSSGNAPEPSDLVKSARWATTILGAMFALGATPFLYREVDAWGVFDLMAGDYGDGALLTLIKVGFAIGLFGLILLATRMVALAVFIGGAMLIPALWRGK